MIFRYSFSNYLVERKFNSIMKRIENNTIPYKVLKNFTDNLSNLPVSCYPSTKDLTETLEYMYDIAEHSLLLLNSFKARKTNFIVNNKLYLLFNKSKYIYQNYKISEDLLKKFINEENCKQIAACQELSEDFVKWVLTEKDYLIHEFLLLKQNLSVEFVEENYSIFENKIPYSFSVRKHNRQFVLDRIYILHDVTAKWLLQSGLYDDDSELIIEVLKLDPFYELFVKNKTPEVVDYLKLAKM